MDQADALARISKLAEDLKHRPIEREDKREVLELERVLGCEQRCRERATDLRREKAGTLGECYRKALIELSGDVESGRYGESFMEPESQYVPGVSIKRGRARGQPSPGEVENLVRLRDDLKERMFPKCGRGEAIEWVGDNLVLDWQDVEQAPSMWALGLFRYAKRDEDSFRKLYEVKRVPEAGAFGGGNQRQFAHGTGLGEESVFGEVSNGSETQTTP